MASKSKYVKLSVGPAFPLSRRTSVMGARVVGEWNEDGARMLLFERTVEIGKGTKAGNRPRKANAVPKAPQTMGPSFPGADVTHGS